MLAHTSMTIRVFCILSGIYITASATAASESFCPNGNTPNPAVIWCDSFEDNDLPASGNIGDNYYEFDSANGTHRRSNNDSIHGQYALQAEWLPGQTDAGHLIRTFGRSPVNSQSHSDRDFKEIYWRMYLKYPEGSTGRPHKLSRVTSFATTNRAQSMIAHIWRSNSNEKIYVIDPATGIDDTNQLATTQYNDFANLSFLGLRESSVAIENNRWYCIEARVKLNNANKSDGIFELWIDEQKVASRKDLDWVGNWNNYGINSLFISHWWNGGSDAPTTQRRYIDALVISQTPIGCLNSPALAPPSPPNSIKLRTE